MTVLHPVLESNNKKAVINRKKIVQSLLVIGFSARQRSRNFMSAPMKFLHLYKLPVAEDFPEQDVD